MSRRYRVADGIVIRRTALPSGDVVATLLGEDGKFRVLARKGKLPGGNLGRLSLFHDVTVQYYRRNDDDLALITQVQLNGALAALSRPEVYPYAHLLAELTDRLTVEAGPGGGGAHAGDRVHAYFTSGLRGLCRHDDPEAVALVYAWKLLGLAGLTPRVARCTLCGRDGPLAFLDVAAGGLTCESCRRGLPLAPRVADDLRLLVVDGVTEGLAALGDDPNERLQHWRVLARYLAFHVADLRSFATLAAARRPGDARGAASGV